MKKLYLCRLAPPCPKIVKPGSPLWEDVRQLADSGVLDHKTPIITITLSLWIALVLLATGPVAGQDRSLTGQVLALPDSTPLPGASIIVKGSTKGTISDAEGNFALTVPQQSTLVISFIGYASQEMPVSAATPNKLEVVLQDDNLTLGEVEIYSTGYQDIPPERATGSFTQVDNELFNRSVSTDVISRLEGVTSGLYFDHRGAEAGSRLRDGYHNLRIRGISTINSDANPLVVVDNFPYEGNINDINPNNVESITVLKDAAAASIWGSRAGNGVIVITTKQGKYNKPIQVNFTGNWTVEDAPDLYYNPNYLPSSAFIELEKELFQQDLFESAENGYFKPNLSPAIEIFIKERDGLITSEEAQAQLGKLAQNDIRNQAKQYLFQKGVRQQYALNINGGTDNVRYYIAGGYDANRHTINGFGKERVTLNSRQTLRLSNKLSLENTLSIASSSQRQNGIGWGSAAVRFPYNKLADEQGNYLPVTNNYRATYLEEAQQEDLLDWQFRPLQELALNSNALKSRQYRVNTALTYEIINNLDISARYQYQYMDNQQKNLIDRDSYEVRDLVNRFTQEDGQRPFPYGDILRLSHDMQIAHAGRLQAAYSKILGTKHKLNVLAGAEVRQTHYSASTNELFGYDDNVLTSQTQLDYITRFDVRPRGRAYLPTPSSAQQNLLDRYTSLYGNFSYTYDGRLTISGSARRDASNLFGVKTNQKAVPLWSAGLAWELSRENFYHISWLPLLKLRSTYGSNGMVNQSATAFTTIEYISQGLVTLPAARITNPGNPQLKWEKVKVFNMGLDMALQGRRVSSSIEYFIKKGEDLLGPQSGDPTTGIGINHSASALVNYASTTTYGLDMQVSSINIDRALRWETTLLINYSKTRLTEYNDEAVRATISSYMRNGNLKLKEGNYVDVLYTLPWHGLDPATGDPIVYSEGLPTKDYASYYNALEVDDLEQAGPGVPPITGAIRNTLRWKGLALSFNITWKTGYYFRRNSINYSSFISSWDMHRDAENRWRQPGDERNTNVPSAPITNDAYRDYVYQYSDILIEKGDHIRLQDVRLDYEIPLEEATHAIKQAKVFLYVRNPGILWSANNKGLDPDYPEASLVPGMSISLGVNLVL